jgi:hypothetical protein
VFCLLLRILRVNSENSTLGNDFAELYMCVSVRVSHFLACGPNAQFPLLNNPKTDQLSRQSLKSNFMKANTIALADNSLCAAAAQHGPKSPHCWRIYHAQTHARTHTITHTHTCTFGHTYTHPVGLLWTSDQLVAEALPTQHTRNTKGEPKCPQRDSNS